MICLTVATGVTATGDTAADGASRAERAPAMMKPMPLPKSAPLRTNSQWIVRMSGRLYVQRRQCGPSGDRDVTRVVDRGGAGESDAERRARGPRGASGRRRF